ncbi:acylphosphatase [Chitinilyticum aquatile]|uniref:acylphosphatase n=1 Tax=Chitinilyticum aquatile TaxID=362520 RepID=UPI0004006B8C|nr:acylphosphatase [Chitinilyticum aquatile]
MHAQRFRVYGRVQGVGFRYSTCLAALRLGLAGWVRNRLDGSVEVHAEGTPEQLRALAAWLQKGPPAARVERVQTDECPLEGLQDFAEHATR